MLGPLVVAVGRGCWWSGRTGANPERLTAVMMAAFAAKLVFFGRTSR